MARTTGAATDLITFSRASSGTALTKVAYGPELTQAGVLVAQAGWTDNGDGSFTANATSFNGVAWNGLDVVINEQYLIEFVVSRTSGTLAIFLGVNGAGSDQVGSIISSSSTISRLHTFVGTSPNFTIRANPDFVGTISAISVRKVLHNDPTGTLKLISHPTNKPRVEYDANGVAKGLLIEEARANLIHYSEDFSQLVWKFANTGSTTLSNVTTAPDGTLSADEMREDLTTGEHRIFGYSGTWTTVSGTTYAFSIYLKANGRTKVQLAAGGLGGGATTTFDLLLETATGSGTITSVGNGWYRCVITGTSPSGGLLNPIIRTDDGSGILYQGDGASGIYIWGAQLEAGSFPTSYIPTSGATATRSADLAFVSVSEFGYNDAQGTFVVDFQTPDSSDANVVDLGITSNDRFLIRNGLAFYRTTAGLAQVTINYGSSTNNQRVAFAVQTNDAVAAVNGAIVGTDTTVTLFSDPTTLEIGALVNNSAVEKLNGHIKSINYYPLRLSDAKLQELTS